MLKTDILHTAINNLEKTTRSTIHIEQLPFVNGQKWDALMVIDIENVQENFKIEVKKQVHQSNITGILEQLKEEGLLIAQYISQPSKTLLEQKGINYLDIAGNCFIKGNTGLFWKINGLQYVDNQIISKHKAFNKNGIKLILALLLDEQLVNQSYRVQAQKANISASTVGNIHQDLMAAKFLFKLNSKEKQLVNKVELFQRWISAYQQKLSPKLFRGNYRLATQKELPNWQDFSLKNDALWGGEPAADALTNYLQPEKWTLYTNLDKRQLQKQFALIPDTSGNISIHSTFWKLDDKTMQTALNTVHPILIYADLLSTNNNRNFETAQKIYEQYIKNILE